MRLKDYAVSLNPGEMTAFRVDDSTYFMKGITRKKNVGMVQVVISRG